MSKLDDKYIENLAQFTTALENIVEELKAQQKAGTKDPVNDMLKQIPKTLSNIVEQQKNILEILDGKKGIKSDTTAILKEIKEIKGAKEKGGMFSSISNVDNQKKMTDAVKSIVLIAAGVLAIGMAFKLVGNVDFKSVVGLSISIFLMVETFKRIVELKFETKDVFVAVLVVGLVSLSLVGAAMILDYAPTINKEKMISLMFVGATIGITTYLLLKSVEKIDIKKNWATLILLPFILPVISLSLLLSSYILSGIQIITWEQAISIAIVGLAVGIASFAVGLAMKGIKGLSWKEILAIPIVIPLVAAGITLSSLIFTGFQKIENPMDLLIGSAVIGLSILIFTPSLIIIGKLIGKNVVALAVGALGIVVIAAAIVATAWLFKLLPDGELKYPSMTWGFNVGLGMLAFVPALVILGAIAATGIGAVVLVAGALSIIGLAATMLAVAKIFEGEKFEGGPSISWSWGVGVGLVIFAAAAIIAIPGMIVAEIVEYFGGEDPLIKLAKSMVAVSIEIQKGEWGGNSPSLSWVAGVGLGLIEFAAAAIIAIPGMVVSDIIQYFGGEDPLTQLAKSMVAVSIELQKGEWNGNYPSLEWATGVGAGLVAFAAISVGASASKLISGIMNFFSGDDDPIDTLAKSMVSVSKELQNGEWEGNYPTLDWAAGVGAGLVAFAAISVGASAGKLLSGIMNFFSGDDDPIGSLAKSMVAVSIELQNGEWSGNYPTLDWATGVGAGLAAFAAISVGASGEGLISGFMNLFSGDDDPIGTLAKSMVSVSIELQKGSWTPTTLDSWVESIKEPLVKFSKIIKEVDIDEDDMEIFNKFLTTTIPYFVAMSNLPIGNIDPFAENINKFTEVINKIPEDKHKAINNLSSSIKGFTSALDGINVGVIDKLSSMSAGIMLVSVIDNEKLKNTLDLISDKESELKEVFGEKESNLDRMSKWVSGLISDDKESTTETTTSNQAVEPDLNIEEFYGNIADIKQLLTDIKAGMNKPPASGNFTHK